MKKYVLCEKLSNGETRYLTSVITRDTDEGLLCRFGCSNNVVSARPFSSRKSAETFNETYGGKWSVVEA